MSWTLIGFALITMLGYGVASARVLTPEEANAANRSLLFLLAVVAVALVVVDGTSDADRLLTLVRRFVWGGAGLVALGLLDVLAGIEVGEPAADLPLLSWNQISRPTSSASSSSGSSGPRRTRSSTGSSSPWCCRFGVGDARGRRSNPAVVVAERLDRDRVLVLALPLGRARARHRRGGDHHHGHPAWIRRRLVLAVLAAVLAVRMVSPGLLGVIRGLFLGLPEDGSFQVRVSDYGGIASFLDGHVWFGRGLGTFLPDQYLLLDNQFLKLLLEGGVVGVAAYAVLLLVGIVLAIRVRRTCGDPRLGALALAAAITVAVGLTTSFTFDFLGFTMARSVLFLSLGLVGVCWR